MRWTVFFVFAVGAVVLETSDLTFRVLMLDRLGDLYPSFTGILVVFVALFAPRTPALWAAWLAGVLLDLAVARGEIILVGPHALGFVFGTYLVLQVRTMVFRQRILTAALLTVLCLVASGVVEVAILTLRMWLAAPDGPSAAVHPMMELGRRVGIAAYSGLLAVPVCWLLMQTAPLWGFEHAIERRRAWR